MTHPAQVAHSKGAGDEGVVTMAMIGKVSRLHQRDKRSVRELAKATSLSRTTVRKYLRMERVTEPQGAVLTLRVAVGDPGRQQSSRVDGFLPRRWRSSSAAARAAPLHLYRRALDRPERAEHAAVTSLRPQHGLAALALVEELAGVGGHELALGVAALGAGQHRRQLGGGRSHLRTADGKPASVVALTSAVALVLSASNVTVAVFFSKSIRA